MNKIIVSFTSYPKRISTIDKVLDSIVNQTELPDKIILYLSSAEFEDIKNIPVLTKYEKYGFEIHWHEENLKSHKKWFYAFQEYPDDIIITIDDDIIYCNTALENLLKYHELYTESIIARRAHLITCNEDHSIALYDDWYGECSVYVGVPRMDLLATTGAGTLFPPHVFSQEIFHKSVFMKLCPYADDIWMKIMGVYSSIPVVLAEKTWEDRVIMEYQANCLVENFNKDGGNDRQLRALLNWYTCTLDGKNLKKHIFSTGRMIYSDVKKIKKDEFEKALKDLVKEIRLNDKILIYGAGRTGYKIYKLLQNRRVENISAFIVNDVTNNPDMIGKISVKCYKEFINSPEKIFIALADVCESNNVYMQLIKDGVEKSRIVFLNRLVKQALFSDLLEGI